MQTFVPWADLAGSAAVLDDRRLGKQRVETLQVLRALTLPDYGWARHPAVSMWRGAVSGLVGYGLACVEAWTSRGYADSTRALITEFAPDVVGLGQGDLADHGLLPDWFGDDAVHASHRDALVRKDPDHYRRHFPDADPERPYVWPPGRHDPAPPPDGPRLWVVRAPSSEQVEHFLAGGYVGLDATSGVDVDAGDADDAELAALLRERAPRRRPGKALRQLRALVGEVQRGDAIGLLAAPEDELVVGEVAGDYTFAGPAPGVVHRRPVRWAGRLAREAARPPALLQDPRHLFAVPVDPDALATARRGSG
ncbi:hypothetical protein GCM10027446_22700 [Angustibacter peucedani]